MLFFIGTKNSHLKIIVDKTVKNVSSNCNVSKVKVDFCAKTTIRACTVRVTARKTSDKKFRRVVAGRKLVRGLRWRRAYRRSQATKSRLSTPGIGLSPRLAYDLVMHTAPDDSSCTIAFPSPRMTFDHDLS